MSKSFHRLGAKEEKPNVADEDLSTKDTQSQLGDKSLTNWGGSNKPEVPRITEKKHQGWL